MGRPAPLVVQVHLGGLHVRVHPLGDLDRLAVPQDDVLLVDVAHGPLVDGCLDVIPAQVLHRLHGLSELLVVVPRGWGTPAGESLGRDVAQLGDGSPSPALARRLMNPGDELGRVFGVEVRVGTDALTHSRDASLPVRASHLCTATSQ